MKQNSENQPSNEQPNANKFDPNDLFDLDLAEASIESYLSHHMVYEEEKRKNEKLRRTDYMAFLREVYEEAVGFNFESYPYQPEGEDPPLSLVRFSLDHFVHEPSEEKISPDSIRPYLRGQHEINIEIGVIHQIDGSGSDDSMWAGRLVRKENKYSKPKAIPGTEFIGNKLSWIIPSLLEEMKKKSKELGIQINS
jgi:hypothetical protein